MPNAKNRTKWSGLDWGREGGWLVGQLAGGTELVLLNLDRGLPSLETDDAAPGDQLQGRRVVELGRPTDGQFQAATGNQHMFAGKKDPVAAHVDGMADAGLVCALFAEHLITYFAFNRKAIRAASISAVLCVVLRVRVQWEPPTVLLRVSGVCCSVPLGQPVRSTW